MHKSIVIDSVTPSLLQEGEPIRVCFSIDLPANSDARVVTVTLLTDDARLQLVEHGGEDSPPEKLLPAQPGAKISKTMTVSISRRKGLVEDTSLKLTPSPLRILARLKTDRNDGLGFASSSEVMVAGLPRMNETKIFS